MCDIFMFLFLKLSHKVMVSLWRVRTQTHTIMFYSYSFPSSVIPNPVVPCFLIPFLSTSSLSFCFHRQAITLLFISSNHLRSFISFSLTVPFLLYFLLYLFFSFIRIFSYKYFLAKSCLHFSLQLNKISLYIWITFL